MKQSLYSEKDLIYPALDIIKCSGGILKTSELIKKMEIVLKPRGEDAEILFGRRDSRFSQKVRNMISHRTITEYAEYDSKNQTLSINEYGINYLLDKNNKKITYLLDEVYDQNLDDDGEINIDNQDYYDISENDKIITEINNSSIYELKRKYDKSRNTENPTNSLILDESFQRTGDVWSSKQRSQLIESALLGIPLPFFYLSEDKNNNLIVIDGRQRFTAFFDFLDGKFNLKGLEFLKHLNGKNIRDFSGELEKYRANIEDTYVYVVKIKLKTSEFFKLKIFSRVNKNGSPLNAQEMRHALHQGSVTVMLEELSSDVELGVKKNRMKDRYLILRYITLRLFYLDSLFNYINNTSVEYINIDVFLGEAMDAINTFSEEQIINLKEDFRNTYSRASLIFNSSAFRFSESTPINMILFESTLLLVTLLEKYSDIQIIDSLNKFKSSSVSLENNIIDFYDNVKFHRDSKENYIQRINWIKEIVDSYD